MNFDALGLPGGFTKPKKHVGFSFDPYKPATKWVRDYIERYNGATVTDVRFDSELELWTFYDGDAPVVRLEHDWIVRLLAVLVQIP